MSHKNNTINFVIHDTNGQPQMVKVVQNTNPTAAVKLKDNPVKLIKLPINSEANLQAPVYRTVKLSGLQCMSKVVQLPVDTITNFQNILTKTEPVEEIQVTEPEEIPTEINIEVEEQEEAKVVTEGAVSIAPNTSRPVMSYASRRRHNSDNDPPVEYTTKRRKHADKVGKGLRHFSMKVCEKVRTKGFTSYNEVADELVEEFAAGMHGSDSQQYDQKNIRRRVYDALNVLMAMNIISKEKKEIRWLGLPTNSIQECNTLEKEKQTKIERIQKKTQHLQELLMQHISFKSLIERNQEAESKGVKPSPSSAIHLPFIVVNTSDKALIDCSISNDKTEYMFNFNRKFQIHDDIDILKRMGLLFGLDKGECSENEIKRAKGMVPKSLEHYVECMGKGETSNFADTLEEDEGDDVVDEDTLDGLVDAEPEHEEIDDEANDCSDDSSDVYV